MEDKAKQAMQYFFTGADPGIPRTLAPGITAKVFCGEQVMLSFVTLEPHSESPVHSHPNEQWGVLLEGEWERIQGGERRLCKAGDFWYTPGGMPHGGRTFDKRAVILDIFAPPREEYKRSNLR